MGNWEQVHTYVAVCKFWRHSSVPHLSNIEKVPIDGEVEHRLNIGAFLRFLQMEHFRNVQCIFIPCGKTKGLFVNDIKQACPSVQNIVHTSEVYNKMIFMGHQVLSCHVPVVRSFFIYFKIISSS
jgi:hypothetical protein